MVFGVSDSMKNIVLHKSRAIDMILTYRDIDMHNSQCNYKLLQFANQFDILSVYKFQSLVWDYKISQIIPVLCKEMVVRLLVNKGLPNVFIISKHNHCSCLTGLKKHPNNLVEISLFTVVWNFQGLGDAYSTQTEKKGLFSEGA